MRSKEDAFSLSRDSTKDCFFSFFPLFVLTICWPKYTFFFFLFLFFFYFLGSGPGGADVLWNHTGQIVHFSYPVSPQSPSRFQKSLRPPTGSQRISDKLPEAPDMLSEAPDRFSEVSTGSWRPLRGSWRSKTGSWRPKTGSWRPKTGS